MYFDTKVLKNELPESLPRAKKYRKEGRRQVYTSLGFIYYGSEVFLNYNSFSRVIETLQNMREGKVKGDLLAESVYPSREIKKFIDEAGELFIDLFMVSELTDYRVDSRIYGVRWETKEEMEERKRKLKETRKKRAKRKEENTKIKEKQEYDQYLKLKKKFEKKA